MNGGQVFMPAGSPPSDNSSCSVTAKEQDRSLPIANVGRIMKRSLPANAKISKEAKETVQECASEFISFITGEAFDKCQREKRKTVSGEDLLWAMTTLGFDSYVGPLKAHLSRYTESEGEKNAMEVQPPEAAVASGKCYQRSTNHEEKSFGGGFNAAAHGLFGGMVVGVCEHGGGQGGGRGPLQGKQGYGDCFL